MIKLGDITKLKASWTKYDCVNFIEIIGNNELASYINGSKGIDTPVLKHYLGINSVDDHIPDFWNNIQKFPQQKKMFALVAGIFTHHLNIKWFAENFSEQNMGGQFKILEKDKHFTNLRSALVISGAAKNSYRRKETVPYDFSLLFEEGEIGLFFKSLVIQRLFSVGYNFETDKDLFEICYDLNFHKAISLNKEQFRRWLDGKSVSQIKIFKYDLKKLAPDGKIQTLKVNQWLSQWDDIDFTQPMRKKPQSNYFIFSMDIRLLKRLSDVHRRKSNVKKVEDTFIQRGHDAKRSLEINKFVEGGFPWSTLSDKDKLAPENQTLKMPGILPTAIVANILGKGERRGKAEINLADLITIEDEGSQIPKLVLPQSVFDEKWDPELKPLEIIDGQHRLMAFDEAAELTGNYEVPVVAYFNLDRAWQAYLFYVINIKPKKINTSLGYDLYPLLRSQDWLENSKDGLTVYRETRAQELVEALWLYEQSPWFNKINMLGVNEGGTISQAAFIRALTNSYLKKTIRKNTSGLFADILPGKNFEEIRWVRAQQAAFLILLWEQIALKASSSENGWAKKLREEKKQLILFDSFDKKFSVVSINDSFLSKNSMLSHDQGVSGISSFSNDFFFVAANYFNDFDFNEIEWSDDIDERQIEIDSIDIAINQFRNAKLYQLIIVFSEELMKLDWRSYSAPFEPTENDQQERQKKYRGSGGYSEVYKDLLNIFINSDNSTLKAYALELSK
ncbi:DGQHR domain-containing protein [uncultured Flavobacterium sp.]|uniref:DGQHR domain-containing protein n=1 Tax=uncultured Flavobacterium sp. TaxID=165435 RepID=UPI0025CF63B0|nr:DGQHR domain-containing protein [uncultured Flavobacterium sp.]